MGGIKPKPLTAGGHTAPKTNPLGTAEGWKPPVPKPRTGPAGEQLKLPGVHTEHQLGLPFDKPPAPKSPPVHGTPQGNPQQLDLFKPPAGDATTAATDAVKTVDVAKDTSNVTKATAGTNDATRVTKAVDHAKPAISGGGTVAKDATAVNEVTKGAAKAADIAKDAAKGVDVAKDANAVAQVTKDASVVAKAAPVVQDAQALAKATRPSRPSSRPSCPRSRRPGR